MNPFSVLKAAIRALPPLKFALGVAGVAAVVSIILHFGLNPRVAIFGTLIVIGVMFLLVVFADAAGAPRGGFRGPATVLVWFVTILAMTSIAIVAIGAGIRYWDDLDRSGRPAPLPSLTPPSATATASGQPYDPSHPVACKDMKGWPVGQWYNWGRFTNPPSEGTTDGWKRIPQVWPEATVTSSETYESRTEEPIPPGKQGTVRNYHAHVAKGERIAPGALIHFHGNDGTGYSIDETLNVSPDGCLMWGDQTDTSGNEGKYFYLYEKAHPAV